MSVCICICRGFVCGCVVGFVWVCVLLCSWCTKLGFTILLGTELLCGAENAGSHKFKRLVRG